MHNASSVTSILLRSCFCELVEDMEIPLIGDLSYHSRFLQQVIVDVCSHRFSLGVELNLQVLAKSRRVVVAESFGIPERFE